MKKSLLFFFVSFSIVNLYSQNLKVSGKILDSANDSVIVNVNVSIDGNSFSTSNKDGKFLFDKVSYGIHKLAFTHVGYKFKMLYLEFTSDTILAVYLEPNSVILENITVTSSKYEQNVNDLSYSAAFITKTKISKSPSLSVADLLKYEPGLSLVSDGSWGKEINIRGLNRSNIVTLVDGNRVETATDISARLSLFDLNDIERIEVIKGASSSLYGSGATGGIINIVSKTAGYSDKFYVKGNLSNGYNTVNENTTNGLSLFSGSSNWLAKISASYRNAGNTQTPKGELENSQFKDYSFGASFQLNTFADQFIKLDYQQFKAEDVGISGGGGLFPENAKVTYPQEVRRMINAEYVINNISSSFNKLSFKYFHQFIYRDVENEPNIINIVPGGDGQPAKRVSVLKITPHADHNTDGFQTQANYSINKNNFLIAGFDFWKRSYKGERAKVQKIEVLSPVDNSVIKTINKTTVEHPLPDAEFNSAGIYLQNESSMLNKKLSLTIGARYDYIWLNNKETSNPIYEIIDEVINYNPSTKTIIWETTNSKNNSYAFNAGLLYSFSEQVTLTFNAAHSFRSPSLEERYQYIDLGSYVRLGDPDLKPEKGNSFDLGVRVRNNKLKLDGSVFINFMNDLVTEMPGTYEDRAAYIKQNIGEAVFSGFDFGCAYQMIDDLLLYGNLSYVNGKDVKEDTNLPQIPPLNGVIGLKNYSIPWMEIDVSSVIFNEQNNTAAGEISTPGYAYFNLYCNLNSYKLAFVELNISLGIENIFDKKYRDHLSTTRGFLRLEPGRNFFIKTNIAW